MAFVAAGYASNYGSRYVLTFTIRSNNSDHHRSQVLLLTANKENRAQLKCFYWYRRDEYFYSIGFFGNLAVGRLCLNAKRPDADLADEKST
jgi:hypothetical protein